MPTRDFSADEAVRHVDHVFPGEPADNHSSGFQPRLSGDWGSPLRSGVARLDGLVSQAGITQPHSGTLSGGWQHASWPGNSDGGAFGATCSTGIDAGSRFDRAIPKAGYAWWYVDAISDDGRNAFTVIVLLGSVFSPYYATARRRGDADPLNHCAFNVALYGPNSKRWAMTERAREALSQSVSSLAIANSSISFGSDHVLLSIDEISVPIPRRIQGKIRLYPLCVGRESYRIDPTGRHLWRPIAPSARVEVEMTAPSLRWQGHGYFDHNRGATPLEDDFSDWTWTRLSMPEGSAIFYDTTARDGRSTSLALRFDEKGRAIRFGPPPMLDMPMTKWRIKRKVRSDNAIGTAMRSLEDTPFYARSAVTASLNGTCLSGMHESLSLDRFRLPVVQWMLPFRMPRRT